MPRRINNISRYRFIELVSQLKDALYFLSKQREIPGTPDFSYLKNLLDQYNWLVNVHFSGMELTIFHYIDCLGDIDFIKYLISIGGNPWLPDLYGRSGVDFSRILLEEMKLHKMDNRRIDLFTEINKILEDTFQSRNTR